jgi:ribonuclease Z
MAKGADLVVHSIGAARQELLDSAPIWKLIMDHHIQPEDAGLVFAEIQPRLAAFTHIVALTNGKIPPVGKAEIMERARTTYDGPLIMGEDLMIIRIGKDEVVAEPWSG